MFNVNFPYTPEPGERPVTGDDPKVFSVGRIRATVFTKQYGDGFWRSNAAVSRPYKKDDVTKYASDFGVDAGPHAILALSLAVAYATWAESEMNREEFRKHARARRRDAESATAG